MRSLLIVLAALVLVGCASTPLPVDNLASSAQTPVTDLRSKEEGSREVFSYLITSDQYGYFRLGQELTEPTGPRLFAHRLQEKHRASAVPPTKLHHFVVYLNNRAGLQNFAIGVGIGGIVGATLSSGTINREGDTVHTLVDPESFAALSGANEYKRALYDPSELKADTAAYVIFIESESPTGRRFTRTVAPVAQKQEEKRIPLHRALESAIQFHLAP